MANERAISLSLTDDQQDILRELLAAIEEDEAPREPAPPAVDGGDETFARVQVISLARTPDRLRNFWKRFPAGWRYRRPQVFDAIDGETAPVPPGWNWNNSNAGAIGCRASWLAIIQSAIEQGIDKPILVMEDDCQFLPGACDRIQSAMAAMKEWDILFLGGEHHRPLIPFAPGLARTMETGRTHALAIHPRFFKRLHEFWQGYAYHVDHGLRAIAAANQFFTLDPVVAIQGVNVSTLRGRLIGAESWDSRINATLEEADGLSHPEKCFRYKLAARQSADWPLIKPEVFYHVACMGNWVEVVIEQLRLLAYAGITRATAAVLGEEDQVDTVNRIAESCGVDLAVKFASPDTKLCEMPTLTLLDDWCKARTSADPVMYLHTKGVSQPNDLVKKAWRRLMQRHVVWDWRANVERLKLCDAVGVDYQNGNMPHFSGNFWLARSDWIETLPRPMDYRLSRPDFNWAGHSWRGRMYAETWLLSRPWHHIESLACQNENIWEGKNIFRFESRIEGFDPDRLDLVAPRQAIMA